MPSINASRTASPLFQNTSVLRKGPPDVPPIGHGRSHARHGTTTMSQSLWNISLQASTMENKSSMVEPWQRPTTVQFFKILSVNAFAQAQPRAHQSLSARILSWESQSAAQTFSENCLALPVDASRAPSEGASQLTVVARTILLGTLFKTTAQRASRWTAILTA